MSDGLPLRRSPARSRLTTRETPRGVGPEVPPVRATTRRRTTHSLVLGPAAPDSTIVDRVVEALIAHVRGSRLPAGAPLPSELRASAELGVSRGVVREAYRSLATAGIAEIANGRSPRVGRVTNRSLIQLMEHAVSTDQASAEQILELRSSIEERAVELAVVHHTREDIELLRRAVTDMRAAGRSKPAQYLVADIRFHEIIGRATGNALFALLATALREAMATSMRASLRGRSRTELSRVIRTHSQIVDAIEAGRSRDARRLMLQHFAEALESVRRMRTAQKPAARIRSAGQIAI